MIQQRHTNDSAFWYEIIPLSRLREQTNISATKETMLLNNSGKSVRIQYAIQRQDLSKAPLMGLFLSCSLDSKDIVFRQEHRDGQKKTLEGRVTFYTQTQTTIRSVEVRLCGVRKVRSVLIGSPNISNTC